MTVPETGWRGAWSARVLNKFEKFAGFPGEARVRYGNGEFQVINKGDFVRCAVTGAVIPLSQLKYWSVDLQEPYASVEASLQRYMQNHRG